MEHNKTILYDYNPAYPLCLFSHIVFAEMLLPVLKWKQEITVALLRFLWGLHDTLDCVYSVYFSHCNLKEDSCHDNCFYPQFLQVIILSLLDHSETFLAKLVCIVHG